MRHSNLIATNLALVLSVMGCQPPAQSRAVVESADLLVVVQVETDGKPSQTRVGRVIAVDDELAYLCVDRLAPPDDRRSNGPKPVVRYFALVGAVDAAQCHGGLETGHASRR